MKARAAFAIFLGAALLPASGLAAPRANTPENIVREIRREILALPNYGLFDSITFSLEGDTVILSGYASRPTLRESAASVVKDIAGVERVENRIEVLPLSRFDDEIRARAYVAIYGDPALARYNPNRGVPLLFSPARIAAGITNDPPPGAHPIHIIVNNGHITLTGVVDTRIDRQLAEVRANTVFGALSVKNELETARGR